MRYSLAGLLLFIFIMATAGQSGKDIFKSYIAQSVNSSMDILVKDYSQIGGLYTSGGIVKGSASTGPFPSFRAGTTVGVILFDNPFRFLQVLKISSTDWEAMKKNTTFKPNVFGPLDNRFLPLPVHNFHFEVALPHNLSVGGRFHIIPVGELIKAGGSTSTQTVTLWGFGVNLSYLIMSDHKFRPALAVSTGFQYSDSHIHLKEVNIGTVYLDSNNSTIPAYIAYDTHFFSPTFYFDFTLSKRIKFFEPYLNLKFSQTISYNITRFSLRLSTDQMDALARSLYGDGLFQLDNLNQTDLFGNPYGIVTPVPDFIISTGFEFIIKIFRLGMEGSFGAVSQKGMVTLSMRFQVEKEHFEKIKQKREGVKQ